MRLTTRDFEVLESQDVTTITNGLRVAAEVFDGHVEAAEQTAARIRAGESFALIAEGDNGVRAMAGLADQFRRQAADSRRIADLLDEAVNVVVSNDEDMEWTS